MQAGINGFESGDDDFDRAIGSFHSQDTENVLDAAVEEMRVRNPTIGSQAHQETDSAAGGEVSTLGSTSRSAGSRPQRSLVWKYMSEIPNDNKHVFIRSLNPNFSVPTRFQTKSDVVGLVKMLDSALADFLKKEERSRVSSTSDIWTSLNQKSYMTCTCHFIRYNYSSVCLYLSMSYRVIVNLMPCLFACTVAHSKRRLYHFILAFVPLPESHTGEHIAEKMTEIFDQWGFKVGYEISAIVLDNASNNTVAVRDHLNLGAPINDRDYIFHHVRCSGHIINLIAQCGLVQIQELYARLRCECDV